MLLKPYRLGKFVDDCEAQDWLNTRVEEGYSLQAIRTQTVMVYDRARRRDMPEVAIVLLVRLKAGIRR